MNLEEMFKKFEERSKNEKKEITNGKEFVQSIKIDIMKLLKKYCKNVKDDETNTTELFLKKTLIFSYVLCEMAANITSSAHLFITKDKVYEILSSFSDFFQEYIEKEKKR